jgi:hypothetical protein
MRVLHLPLNIASQTSVTVRALRQIGVEARGIIISSHVIQSADGLEIFSMETSSRLKRGVLAARRSAPILAAIRWADVVHYHFDASALPRGVDLRWVRLLDKPGVAEFWGSDIRIPEVEAADNPYYARLGAAYEYHSMESYAKSRGVQAKFSGAGLDCLISCNSLRPYLQPDLFPTVYFARQRVWLPEFGPNPPDPAHTRPVIVHSPSAPNAKGTPAVLTAIDSLRGRFDVDFRLIQGVPRHQALKLVRDADIFLDQFVLGAYGMAALEAMALGKPVLCYIKPSMAAQYPADLPIVNATQESLTDIIAELLADGVRRHEIGLRSRAYVEKYHDAIKIAGELKGIYEDLLLRRGTHRTP